MGDKAWHSLEAVSSSHDFLAVCETRVSRGGLSKWSSRARQASLKLFANPARPKSKWIKPDEQMDDRSNEGGEWLLTRNHRPVQYLAEARAAGGLHAERGTMYDGFVPCIVHMRGSPWPFSAFTDILP